MATRQVLPADGYSPGVCEPLKPSNPDKGWFVPYRSREEFPDAYEAVIELYARDLCSAYSGFLPFLVDTGSDSTIIPRALLNHPIGFNRTKAITPIPILLRQIARDFFTGLEFRARICIPSKGGFPPLSFGDELTILVVERLAENHCGVLGLDALREVLVVSDQEHISFWPRLAE